MSARVMKASLVALLLALAACDKPAPTGTGSSGTAVATASEAMTASAAPSAATPATVAVDAKSDPLPTHTDVAKTVRGEVTKANYKTELDKLEKSGDEP